VTDGANLGDTLSFADELVLDDIYSFDESAVTLRLSVHVEGGGHLLIATDTEIGCPGTQIYLDSCLTLMSPDGMTTEVLVLVGVDEKGSVSDIHALPLGQLHPKTHYSLVGIDTQSARAKFAE